MRLPTLILVLIALVPSVRAQIQFAPLGKQHLSKGLFATGLGVADFTGDQRPDVLMARDQRWRVLRNLGGGHFEELQGAIPAAPVWPAHQALLGDLDGDGDVDVLAVPNTQITSDGKPQLFLNNGRGVFQNATSSRSLPAPAVTRAPVLFDCDGDNDLDVFYGNIGTNGLWLNDGAGNFRLDRRRLPTSTEPTSAAAAADIDGDGDLDLAFASGDLSGAATVVLRNGGGFFSPVPRVPAQARVSSRLVWLDIDGDRDLDLVFAHVNYFSAFPEPMAVWRNDGANGFVDAPASVLPPGGFETFDIGVADVDSDGRLDMVVGDWRSASGVEVLRNLSNGTFRPVAGVGLTRPTQFALYRPHLADFDRDGHVDLIDGDRLWLNNQRGGLEQASGSPFSGYSVLPVDIDRDGDLDLVMDRRLYANDGSGQLTRRRGALPSFAFSESASAAGDLDGDGDTDLLLAFENPAPGSGQNRLLLQGPGTVFADATSTGLPQRSESSVAVELFDADRDGDLDAYIANRGFQAPFDRDRLLLNNGAGRMTAAPASALPALAEPSNDVAAGDLDGDGDLDLIVAAGERSWPSRDVLWQNDGRGRFRATAGLPAFGGIGSGVALGDVDGDGDLDCVLTREPTTSTLVSSRLLRNDGRGVFTDRTATDWRHAAGSRSHPQLVDLDGDGDLDLVTSNRVSVTSAQFGGIEVWWNDGSGRFVVAAPATTERVPDGIRVVGAGDFDRDGDIDLLSEFGIMRNTAVDLAAPWLAVPGRPYRFRIGYSPVVRRSAAAVLMVGGGPLSQPLNLGRAGAWFVDPARSVALPAVSIPSATGSVDVDVVLPVALGFGAAFSAQALLVPSGSAPWRVTPPVFDSVQR